MMLPNFAILASGESIYIIYFDGKAMATKNEPNVFISRVCNATEHEIRTF